MPNPPDGEVLSRQYSPPSAAAVSAKSFVEVPAHQWFSEATSRHNLSLLGLISVFLTGVDTFQSFYLQRVVNQFSEANLLPLKFYSNGLTGYLLYTPIDFLALFATLTVLWIWASYLLWYFKHFISNRIRRG
jgi:hypothetical protein